jgi:integrase
MAAVSPSDALTHHLAFTQRAVDTLKPLARGFVEYYDTKTPGLALRVQPTGKKTFYLNYRVPNERRSARWTLGRFPSLTVDQARAKVERAQVLLRDGVDPNPKHAHPTLPAPIVLFSTLAEQFLEQHSKAKKKSWRQDQGWINLYLLPAWKDTPVGQIRRRQVAELLHTITHERHAPRASDVVRSLISRMFRFGIAAGHEDIEYNPAAGTERALDALPKRTRYPDDQHATGLGEFKRLWDVWNDWINTGRPLLGWQFQLRALTAQRGGELLQMRFSDLHKGGTHWIKPFAIRKRKKTAVHQDPYLIPLAPMAVAIIGQIRTYHEQELARKNAAYGGTWNGKKWGWPREAISDFVFPSRTNPAAGARNFWAEEIKELAEKADIADFKPHDLRRWASTNANAVVGNSFWVERYLDHEIGGVAGTYNLHEYAEQKTYVAYAIENKVREAIGKKKIPMPPRPKE